MDTDPHRPCYVYVMRAGEAIKIGLAVNVGARALALQSGNPLPLETVGYRKFPNTLAARFDFDQWISLADQAVFYTET